MDMSEMLNPLIIYKTTFGVETVPHHFPIIHTSGI